MGEIVPIGSRTQWGVVSAIRFEAAVRADERARVLTAVEAEARDRILHSVEEGQ